jgi:hypothetical protein
VTKRKAAEKLAQQAAENELDEAEYASDLAAASDDEDIFTDDTSDSNLGEAESDEIQPTPDFGDNDSFTVPEEENSTDTFGQQDSFGDFFESDSDENNTEDSFGDFQDVESDNQDNNEFPEFIDDESNNNDSDFIDDTESYSESDMDAFPSFDNEENEGTQFTDNDNNFFGDDTQDSESDTFEPDAFGSDSFEPDSDESADDNNSMTIDDEVIQSLLNAQSDESEGSEEQYTEFADESDNQQYTEYSEQPQYDEQPEYDEQPQYDEQQYTESADEQSVLFVAQMSALDQLVWSDEVTFDNIPYIGNNTITYNINKNGSLNTYEDVLCKCIEAVIAIDSNNGNTNIVSMFKKKDLSTVSNFIKLYTDEYKGCTRIKGTKYVITSVDSMSQVATILYDICSALGIDTDTTFIYFYVTTSSQALINDWSYAEDAVQLREFTEYVVDNQVREKTSVAILKGEMFDRITVTKNSLKAHRDIIKKVEAVKTKEVAKKLDTVKDLQETVAEMIQSYINQNNHVDNIRYAAFGVALGTSYRLISENPAEVGPDPIPLELINKTVYMCNLQEWQIVYALIKVHTVLFNNGGIAIKTSVDQNAINFYGEEFESSEPALSLAVKSFVDYVALSITQTNTKSAQNNQ